MGLGTGNAYAFRGRGNGRVRTQSDLTVVTHAKNDEDESAEKLGCGFTDNLSIIESQQTTRRGMQRVPDPGVPIWIPCDVVCCGHRLLFENVPMGPRFRNLRRYMDQKRTASCLGYQSPAPPLDEHRIRLVKVYCSCLMAISPQYA